MKSHMSNVAYGVLDYVAYPAAMLLAAPVLLRHLGAESYGLWSIVTAVVSSGSIVAAGFGDANIKHVSECRGTGDSKTLVNTVRFLFTVNIALGILIAVCVVAALPFAARLIVHGDGPLRSDATICLLFSSVLIVERAVESVFISTQRAFERYGDAVRVSLIARVGSLLAGVALTDLVPHIWIILITTAVCSFVAAMIQYRHVCRVLQVQTLSPRWERGAARHLFQFGKYSWLLAASGVVFGQLDRLVLGVWLGSAAVAPYALCSQIVQPLYGCVAAGLHFLFPHLSNRAVTQTHASLRRYVAVAAAYNVAFVFAGAIALQLTGVRMLLWMGHTDITSASRVLFAPLLWSSALLGISVTATYTLFAFQRVALVTTFSVLGAALCLLCMVWFGQRFGPVGVATARLVYGAASVILYVPLWRMLGDSGHRAHAFVPSGDEA